MRSDFETAWTETAAGLAVQLREAAVDHEGLSVPLRVCELSRCRATCCHDGVYLSGEEARGIAGLGAEEAAGVMTEPRRKTAVRAAAEAELAADYPGHFPRTRCVFLDEGNRCGLQLRSVREERHPWFWKPLTCWMHPLILLPATRERSRPVLTLHSPESDPQQAPGYPGFASCTPCGRVEAGGLPGYEVLAMELRALGELAGRDFLRELRAPTVR